MVVTQREFQNAVKQINEIFDQLSARIKLLEEKLEEEKPKPGRPRKEAA